MIKTLLESTEVANENSSELECVCVLHLLNTEYQCTNSTSKVRTFFTFWLVLTTLKAR